MATVFVMMCLFGERRVSGLTGVANPTWLLCARQERLPNELFVIFRTGGHEKGRRRLMRWRPLMMVRCAHPAATNALRA